MFLFCVFAFCFIVQILFYTFLFSRFAFHKKKNNKENAIPSLPVSIIICTKNEAGNLIQNLPAVLNQQYPDFEVVAVNDRSTDNSSEVLHELQKKYSRLKIFSIEADKNGQGWNKKRAIAAGIDTAQNDILLFTDADCRPAGNLWIQNMMRHFSDGKDIVLGYGAYERTTGFLNKLIRFDSFFIAVQYFSFALAGIPYMGVGRNLAYRKNIYIKHRTILNKKENIPSGDDDLLVNLAAGNKNTAIEINPESVTISVPEKLLVEWVNQKSRHLKTGAYYRLHHKLILGLHAFSAAGMWLFFIFPFIQNTWLSYAMPLVLSRVIIQLFIFDKCLRRTGERNLLLISPILEMILAIIIPFIFIFRSSCLTTSKE